MANVYDIIRKSQFLEVFIVVALKLVLGVVYLIICAILIVLVCMQESKTDGLSGAITGENTESFYGKSKGGMSREKFLVQLTIVLSITFAVVAVVLSMLMRAGV